MIEKSEVVRVLTWAFIAIFFVVAPAGFLYVAAVMIHLLDNSKDLTPVIASFDREELQLLLTFYAGIVGG